MILFYSYSCQHCSILIDTIKKHDTKKTIKLVCVDKMIGDLKHKITNVPALMFLPSKEVIYGKGVFDYLLLPNRGYLFTCNNTREKSNDNDGTSMNAPVPLNKEVDPDEPSAFSLGSILSENFSSITDDDINSPNINENKNYRWDFVNNNNQGGTQETEIKEQATRGNNENRKLPTLEELTKERENLFKDIK
jgi:hypothetical protein